MSPLHVWIIARFYKGKGPYVVVFQVCEYGKVVEQTFVQIDVCTFVRRLPIPLLSILQGDYT